MLTALKVMCQRSYKKRITLPTNNWFTLTENGMLFTYFIDNNMRFITFDSREEVAEFLQENEFIESYTGSGKNLRMYEKKLFTVTGGNGAPVQLARISVLEWDKITFYPSDVTHFACQREYEIQGSIMGLTKAKIRSISSAIIKEAA